MKNLIFNPIQYNNTYKIVAVPTTHLRLLKLCLNLSNDPLEGLDGELVHLGHPLGTEGGSEKDVEEQGGVELGLPRELILPLHYHKLLAKASHILNNLHIVHHVFSSNSYHSNIIFNPPPQ